MGEDHPKDESRVRLRIGAPGDEASPRYGLLVARVDAWTRDARSLHGPRMRCRAGCDACCRRHLSVVSLEAEALAGAARALDEPARTRLARQLADWDRSHGTYDGDAPCPLLIEGLCALYDARPVLCRTHGFPLRTRPSGDPDSGERGAVVWCELNFTDACAAPVEERGILDIDRVNRALGAVQALRYPDEALRRITVREALGEVCPIPGSPPRSRGPRPSTRRSR